MSKSVHGISRRTLHQAMGGALISAATVSTTPAVKETWTEAIDDQTGSESEQFVGHVRNFLDCVKSRQSPIADLTGAHQVGAMCHLANLSLRTGRQLRWDAEKEEIIDDTSANQMLVRPYRAPCDAELRALGIRA